VLEEGAQGSIAGRRIWTFPFVTSANNHFRPVLKGLGTPPHQPDRDVHRWLCKQGLLHRVAAALPTELEDATGGRHYARPAVNWSNTAGPRSCGWIYGVDLRFDCMIKGVHQIVMDKS